VGIKNEKQKNEKQSKNKKQNEPKNSIYFSMGLLLKFKNKIYPYKNEHYMNDNSNTIKIHKLTIKKNNYTRKQKQSIVNKIKPITKEEAIADFIKLRKISPEIIKSPSLERVGNIAVDYFTFSDRVGTTGNKGINFYDFYQNRNVFFKKPYVKKYLKYEENLSSKTTDEKKHYRLFNLYFGSINIFRPIIAMSIYTKYKPTSILDMTMGWGGRAIGAAALDIPHYIGIDLNTDLKMKYNELENVLKPYTKTEFQFIFKNALSVDYSKLNYDLVFTSPPYYSVEKYNHMKMYKTKEDWNEKFYKPLITETYKYLKKGGFYILNVPDEIYKNNCIPLLGVADTKIELKKSTRNVGKYKEYLYIWRKYDQKYDLNK
jgi:hypothetical protein